MHAPPNTSAEATADHRRYCPPSRLTTRDCPRRCCRPCKKTWCGGERRRHLLLCLTSEKHFGNSYTRICSRPEIWLMRKVDPSARDEDSGEIVALFCHHRSGSGWCTSASLTTC